MPDAVPSKLDRQLAEAAIRKQKAGQEPSLQESRALRRVTKAREEELRWQYYRSIPKKHWEEMSGRQRKVLSDQAIRYGIPFGDRVIDLPKVVRAIHDFFAKYKFNLGDEQKARESSREIVDRERLLRLQLAEYQFAEQQGRTVPLEEIGPQLVRAGLIFRRASERIKQLHGNDAGEILNEACDEFDGWWQGLKHGGVRNSDGPSTANGYDSDTAAPNNARVRRAGDTAANRAIRGPEIPLRKAAV